MNVRVRIARGLRTAMVAGTIAVNFGAAAALAAGTGEGVSAPFALYLGPGYAPPTVGGCGSAVSPAFALSLAPGYRHVSAVSGPFALYTQIYTLTPYVSPGGGV